MPRQAPTRPWAKAEPYRLDKPSAQAILEDVRRHGHLARRSKLAGPAIARGAAHGKRHPGAVPKWERKRHRGGGVEGQVLAFSGSLANSTSGGFGVLQCAANREFRLLAVISAFFGEGSWNTISL